MDEEAPEALPKATVDTLDEGVGVELEGSLLARRRRGSLRIGMKFLSTGTYLGLPPPRPEDG